MKTFTDSYLTWVKTNTVETPLPNGWTEISTPFMDRHNDGLVIYAKEDRGEVILSDDGYIIGDMELYGISVNRRIEAIQNFFRGYGVTVTDNKELQVKTTLQAYPVKQHLLLQAMMSASDMFAPTSQEKTTIFLDEVVQFFDANDIFYTPDAQFQGKSGYTHKVDFIIPKGKKNPERFIYAINTPRKNNVTAVLFMWEDIQKNRAVKNKMFAMLNDEKNIAEDAIEAFANYEATPVHWSKRNDYIPDLMIA